MMQKKWGCVVGTILMAGCAVGPTFHRPTAPKIHHYTEHPMPTIISGTPHTIGGETQRFHVNQKITAQWWTVFHSPALNELLQEAVKANPDMTAAAANLQKAQEATKISRSVFLPTLTGNIYPTRQLTAGTLASNLSSNAYLYTLTTESLTVGYMPDVFGGNRRQWESSKALEEAALYQYEAVYLTLTSNIVLNAIQEASLRGQIETTQHIIKILQRLSSILAEKRRLGGVGLEAISEQKLLLAQTQALLPALELQLAENRHQLASLLGRYSSENLTNKFSLKDFDLPKDLPLSLPSELINNRPDIRAAEANMHSASAQIGVAAANRLPSVTLTATGGYMPVSQSLNSIPSFLTLLPLGPSMFWWMGANFAGTIFDAGALYYKKRAAVEAYEIAVAQYKRTVLNAFQSVADSLKALELDAIALRHTQEQLNAAENWFKAVTLERQAGSVSYLDLLIAEKSYENALLTLTQAQATRFSDTVALFQALGGGWTLERRKGCS